MPNIRIKNLPGTLNSQTAAIDDFIAVDSNPSSAEDTKKMTLQSLREWSRKGYTAYRAVRTDSFGNLEASAVTATELSVLSGLTATTEELNTLHGLTATTAEINLLDGLLVSRSELNLLAGLTAKAAELNTLSSINRVADMVKGASLYPMALSTGIHTLSCSDAGFISCNLSAGNISITMPVSGASNAGVEFVVSVVAAMGSNTVTLQRQGTNVFRQLKDDGTSLTYSSLVLNAAEEFVILRSSGNGTWAIIAGHGFSGTL